MSNELTELRNALKTAETRVNVLESELAKKTEVLENTEKLLENSQQQYKEMLMRISEMSQQQKEGEDGQDTQELRKQMQIANVQIDNQTNVISQQRSEIEALQIENEKLKKSLQFHNERDYYTGKQNIKNSGEKIQKTVYQLREAQEDVLDLQAQNENLKMQISKMKREEKEWSECASTVFEELTTTFKISKLFPRSDTLMQRTCLLELVKELSNNSKYRSSGKPSVAATTKQKHRFEKEFESERERIYTAQRCCGPSDGFNGDLEDYRQKYIRAKNTLGRVTEKCDNMLNMMDGVQYNRHRYYYESEPLYQEYRSPRFQRNFDEFNSEKYEYQTTKQNKEKKRTNNCALKSQRKELGKCVKELHGITKQMKNDYQQIFKANE